MIREKRANRYWIYPAFQRRFVLSLLMMQLIVLASTGAYPLILAYAINAAEVDSQHSPWLILLSSFAILFVSVAILLVFLGIRASSRICGPALRLQEALEALQRGEKPGPISLRKDDELQELAEAFNKTFETQLQALTNVLDKQLENGDFRDFREQSAK